MYKGGEVQNTYSAEYVTTSIGAPEVTTTSTYTDYTTGKTRETCYKTVDGETVTLKDATNTIPHSNSRISVSGRTVDHTPMRLGSMRQVSRNVSQSRNTSFNVRNDSDMPMNVRIEGDTTVYSTPATADSPVVQEPYVVSTSVHEGVPRSVNRATPVYRPLHGQVTQDFSNYEQENALSGRSNSIRMTSGNATTVSAAGRSSSVHFPSGSTTTTSAVSTRGANTLNTITPIMRQTSASSIRKVSHSGGIHRGVSHHIIPTGHTHTVHHNVPAHVTRAPSIMSRSGGFQEVKKTIKINDQIVENHHDAFENGVQTHNHHYVDSNLIRQSSRNVSGFSNHSRSTSQRLGKNTTEKVKRKLVNGQVVYEKEYMEVDGRIVKNNVYNQGN